MPRRKKKGRAWTSRKAKRRRRNASHAPSSIPRRLLKQKLSRQRAAALRSLTKTTSGMKGYRRFRKFWRVPYPVKLSWFDERPLKKAGVKVGALVGMGRSDRVVLHLGKKKRTLRGHWMPFTDEKGRRILLLSKKKIQLPFRKVGLAAETWYTPTKGMNATGTHKKNTMWRHLHTDAGGRPPAVYADRGGKVDRHSNFVYARGTYSVTDWIRR